MAELVLQRIPGQDLGVVVGRTVELNGKLWFAVVALDHDPVEVAPERIGVLIVRDARSLDRQDVRDPDLRRNAVAPGGRGAFESLVGDDLVAVHQERPDAASHGSIPRVAPVSRMRLTSVRAIFR